MSECDYYLQSPVVPEDDYTANLYRHYELSENPSVHELEPVATRLLGELSSAHAAVEMVLGRQLDADQMAERYPVISLLMMSNDSPQDKFGALLMVRSIENPQPEA